MADKWSTEVHTESIQMGGINFDYDNQIAHTYYHTGYEQGKTDTLNKLNDALKMVRGIASGRGNASEASGLYEAAEIIREQMEGWK